MLLFLKESLIESQIQFFKFKPIPNQKVKQKRMILDSQAIEHLELIDSKHSLLSYLD
jgi:hypothetical protein